MSPSCPFCGYEPPQIADQKLVIHDLAYHVEVRHPEDATAHSPFELEPEEPLSSISNRSDGHSGTRSSKDFVTRTSDLSRNPVEGFVDCPGYCCEKIPHTELEQHLALHEAEKLALDELQDQYDALNAEMSLPKRRDHSRSGGYPDEDVGVPESSEKSRIYGFFSKTRRKAAGEREESLYLGGRRQGKKELGPHAYEDRMPSWLYRQLERGPPVTWVNRIGSDGQIVRVERVENETPDLIGHLASLCRLDKDVSKAWFCSPGVKHIFKTHREGGFCGYRNIQMLISWMQHHKYHGYERFPESTPNILLLQQMIEDAWDKGFNSSARLETGGIIGTRKFIGTPEAQALFQSLSIECSAKSFTRSKLGTRKDPVHRLLMEQIIDYFSKGVQNPMDKVYMTELPPIYFQHPGHSLTIVGIEVRKEGSVNLLVFDPMFETASSMVRFVGSPSTGADAEKILKAFRRGDSYLKKYKSFEVLSFSPFEK